MPTESAIRRALRRARDGVALDATEAETLLHARGEQLDQLFDAASRVRDAGLAAYRPAGRDHVLAQRLRAAHQAVPRPVPLLHVRHRAGPRAGRVPQPGRGARHRAPRCGAGLHGGAVHPRRPAGGPVGRRARVARGGRLPGHAVLRPRDVDQGARGDRRAAAPQPGRAELDRLPAAQAGVGVDGHDAGDDGHPAVVGEGRARTTARRTRSRRCGCGCSRTRAAATSRSPPAS